MELGKQGQVARYWSTAALLQQAGLEGPSDGPDAGADAVLWRCDLCGVPATSARNLEVRQQRKAEARLHLMAFM